MNGTRSGAYESFAQILGAVWNSANNYEGTIPTGLNSDGEAIRFLADRNNRRTLVVPVASDYAFKEVLIRNISLTEGEHGGRRCMLLSSSDRALEQVFASLVDDILDRLAECPSASPPEVTQSVLKEWLELLRPGRVMSRAETLGLVGELHILILLAEINCHQALQCWTGPLGEVHDFTSPGGAIEVKSSEQDGDIISVSSLEQLDAPASGPLTLVRLTFEETDLGLSVSELVNQAVLLGCTHGELVDRIAHLGHLLGVDQSPYRFKLQRRRQWDVSPDFPGLRSSDVSTERSASITHLKYGLSLSTAPGELQDNEWHQRLTAMVTA